MEEGGRGWGRQGRTNEVRFEDLSHGEVLRALDHWGPRAGE